MTAPILATKLYIPPPRPKAVLRPRLIERLNDGLPAGRAPGVTLISAPAGFGKTTLLSEWVAAGQHLSPKLRVAWLSLDKGDSDPARFLAYFVAALRTIAANIGDGVLGALQAPQPPATEAILTALLNDITALSDPFALVLDDYHVIDAQAVDQAINFLLQHRPPQMHLVIATREDPNLPLTRLRARGQLVELRAADLRFTPTEAAEFLNRVMGLRLSAEDVAVLEHRTEGWIAGLQFAALSMQGHQDAAELIQSFTGRHHFVLDYLVEEVLQRRPEHVQTFLLRTSILERMCGPLCDVVLRVSAGSGQATLEYLERANLFVVPLDNERRWYRYHHLFADLLRQRLNQSAAEPVGTGEADRAIGELHQRASQWYEDNGLDLEAFHHAVAAHDIERAARLVEEKGLPLHSRVAMAPVLTWLATLPASVLNARPSLLVTSASLLLVTGQATGVEEKLQAAETALALQGAEPDAKSQYLVGRIAAARSTLALTRYDIEAMLAQSRRALQYSHPSNVAVRSTALWTMGYAHYLQGERPAASRAFSEAISLSEATGRTFTYILATIGLGNIQEADNQLPLAAETYRRVLQLAGDQPLQIIHEAHLGLARVLYEWNDLEAAEAHGRESLHLARQYESFIDRFVICEVFLARLKLAQGDVPGAAAILAQANQSARERHFVHRLPEVAAAQVLTLLRQGQLAAAAEMAQTHALPLSQARVHLALGDAPAALAALEPWRLHVEAKGWHDEQLRVRVLQAVALEAQGAKGQAVQVLAEALALAEPAGCVRTFVDEGAPIARLLAEAAAQRVRPDYCGKLLASFEAEAPTGEAKSQPTAAQPLIEPLSERELHVLRLIAQGLSNHEISERLFLAVSTVKGHNQRIFDKLQVQRRTEAIARARDLGLL